ncbi:hypothetical protein FHS85_001774 [Rhodoligotrophos appendicifer]|uniref:hypothetical protein n=1 Tax=Rhodoligotrophos appendicifer TaxID=987056 RepID=UPI001186846F|nr:hypothetical protein [Rhodoligotrophos appendicifer]
MQSVRSASRKYAFVSPLIKRLQSQGDVGFWQRDPMAFALLKDGKVIARGESQAHCLLCAIDLGLAAAPPGDEALRPLSLGKYLASGVEILPEAEHV